MWHVGNGGAEPKARQSESSDPHNVRLPYLYVNLRIPTFFLHKLYFEESLNIAKVFCIFKN
jgi:hypothetical protein